MTTPDEERAFWDREASHPASPDLASPARARAAVWGTDLSWEDGIRHCLAMLVPELGGVIRPGRRLLDLGCGMGRMTEAVALCCPTLEVVGVDVSLAMLEEACSSETRPPNTTYVIVDGRSLPPDLGPFDGGWSMLTFQHLESTSVLRYLVAVGRLLSAGAPFRLQWTVDGDDGPFHHQHRSEVMQLWCRHAELIPGRPERDPRFPTWRWLTARKAST